MCLRGILATAALSLLFISPEAQAGLTKWWKKQSLPTDAVSVEDYQQSPCRLDSRRRVTLSDSLERLASQQFNVDLKSLSRDSQEIAFIALSNLPAHFFPFNKEIKMVERSRETHGKTIAHVHPQNGTLTLFSPWKFLGDTEKLIKMTHELAHVLAVDIKLLNNTEWQKLSGWKQGLSDFDYADHANFVSKYATTNPYEDFAESLTAYRYASNTSKDQIPKKYQFLKEVIFGGLEYQNTQSCDEENSNYRDLELAATFDAKELNDRCSLEVARVALKGRDQSVATECYVEEIKKGLVQPDLMSIALEMRYQKLILKLYERHQFPRLQAPADLDTKADEMARKAVDAWRNLKPVL